MSRFLCLFAHRVVYNIKVDDNTASRRQVNVNDLLFTKIYTSEFVEYTDERAEYDKCKHDKVYHLFIIIPVSIAIISFQLLERSVDREKCLGPEGLKIEEVNKRKAFEDAAKSK